MFADRCCACELIHNANCAVRLVASYCCMFGYTNRIKQWTYPHTTSLLSIAINVFVSICNFHIERWLQQFSFFYRVDSLIALKYKKSDRQEIQWIVFFYFHLLLVNWFLYLKWWLNRTYTGARKKTKFYSRCIYMYNTSNSIFWIVYIHWTFQLTLPFTS